MDTKSMSYEMLSHLIALQMNSTNEEVLRALSSWYLKNGKGNIKNWKEEHPITATLNQKVVDDIISEHVTWCSNADIIATPTILINGQKLPDEFSIKDLRYHIRKLLEKVTDSEPVS